MTSAWADGWDDCDLSVVLLLEGGPDDPFRWLPESVPALRAEGVRLAITNVFAAPQLQATTSQLGVPQYELGVVSARGYPAAAVKLRRLVREGDYDLVQGTGPIAGTIAGLSCRLAGRSAIFHRQAISFDGNPRLAILSRFASHLCHWTIACSKAAALAATEIDRVPARRVRVGYNGANRFSDAIDEALGARSRLGIPGNAVVVTAIARLRPVKGIDVLLRAIAEVHSVGDPVQQVPVFAVIVGDGPQRAELEALAASLGLGAVRFVGNQFDVTVWLAMSDIVVVPSRQEAFGVVAAEAMSCGKPVIASDVGGLREVVIDGLTGLLVPPDDVSALARAMELLAQAADLRARYGQVGRQRFGDYFTNEAMARRWARHWRDFIHVGSK